MLAPKCVVLLSGGIDSRLAVRIMQTQNIEVEAFAFQTIFECCKPYAARAAGELGVRLTVVDQPDDYLEVIKHPQHGYGRGANPCVDCRIYMLRRAWELAQQTGASFLVTGEILGQRPMSQKRPDLALIERNSGPVGLLLRPLSAKLLPPTLPEQQGVVDRERLYDFSGRSRKPLIALAHELGIEDLPQPSTGCALTEPPFGQRVFELLEHNPHATRWDFELLRTGRHFRIDPDTKVVLGRDAQQNEVLRRMATVTGRSTCVLVHPLFPGPDALVVGELNPDRLRKTGHLILRFSKRYQPGQTVVEYAQDDRLVRAPIAQAPPDDPITIVSAVGST